MNASPKLAWLISLGLVALVACATGAATEPVETDVSPTEPVDPTRSGSDETSTRLPPRDAGSDPPRAPSRPAGEEDAADPVESPADAGADGGPESDAGAETCAGAAPGAACTIAPQCGCASNETCAVTDASTGAVGCVLAGGGPLGSLCTTTSQCEHGLGCAYGACRPYCETEGEACTDTRLGTCTALYEPVGHAVPNARVCTITCDLRNASDACGSNTCIWDPIHEVSDCDDAGPKDEREACAAYDECKPNLACVEHPIHGFECERWCRIGAIGDCPGAAMCQDAFGANAPTQDGARLGVCQ